MFHVFFKAEYHCVLVIYQVKEPVTLEGACSDETDGRLATDRGRCDIVLVGLARTIVPYDVDVTAFGQP